MAIAYDTSASGNAAATSLTYSHTCTGTNLILYVGVFIISGADQVTGVTYGGVAMTRVDYVLVDTNVGTYLYQLVAPSTGANNVVVSMSTSLTVQGSSSSFTGAAQSGQPDAHTTMVETTNVIQSTTSLTTVADNDWLVAFCTNNSGGSFATSATNLTRRTNFNFSAIFDTNAAQTPAGSKSVTVNMNSGSAKIGTCLSAIKPYVAPAVNGNFFMFT